MSAPSQLPLAAPSTAKSVPQGAVGGSLNPAQATGTSTAPAPVWLQRLSLGVLVIFCLYLGLLIAVLPWFLKNEWDHNAMLLRHPALHAFLMKGPVRGLISGLGLIDLWIGISELIHYRDYRS